MDRTHRPRPDVPDLPVWARRRETGRRVLVHGWALTGAATLALGLTADRYLLVPAVFGLGTVAVLAADALRTRWWRLRRRAAGHPVARAAAPRSLARGRPQPQGWAETLIAGSLHVTATRWLWRPALLCTDDVQARGWDHDIVERLAFTPSWGPGLPASGYLRLTLRHGGTADLLVWDPDVLGLLVAPADDVASQARGRAA